MEDLIKRIYQHLAPLGELCNDEFTQRRQLENLALREACKQALRDLEIQEASNTKEEEYEKTSDERSGVAQSVSFR